MEFFEQGAGQLVLDAETVLRPDQTIDLRKLDRVFTMRTSDGFVETFGAKLIDQPLMRNVLADMAVEAEAATMLAMRMAGATDRAVRGDERETLLRRIGLAAGKYWVCKRATAHAAEAMECFGGNGYAEESGMPRLYREAPLMGIWEGSGNVSALDTLRAMATRPECVDVLFDELAVPAGQDPRLALRLDALKVSLGDVETLEYRARKVAEDISLALQGGLLIRHGHPAVAEAALKTCEEIDRLESDADRVMRKNFPNSRYLGGKDYLARHTAIATPTEPGYQSHLGMLQLYILGKVDGELDGEDKADLEQILQHSTQNPLAHALKAAYGDGNYAIATALLLKYWPAGRLPTTADWEDGWRTQRDDASSGLQPYDGPVRTHSGADFLFTAGIVLGEL